MRRQLAQNPSIFLVKAILLADPVLGILLCAINIEPFLARTNHPPMATPTRSCRPTGLISAVQLIVFHQRACW